VFGPKKLPEMGRSLGHGLRELKDGITGHFDEDDPPRPEPARTPIRSPRDHDTI
jgi:Sec-independent protein translocase protein TatA